MHRPVIYREVKPLHRDVAYTRKKGLIWREVFLPEYAPPEWKDRGVLWNAVEENEKTKDSRLAREFVPALPVELTPTQWQELLSDFIIRSSGSVSFFVLVRFCSAKPVACGRVTERARETRLRFPLHTFPSLRCAGVQTTKVVGNYIKNYRYRCVWRKARRINRFRS